jgi:hypothetical protein
MWQDVPAPFAGAPAVSVRPLRSRRRDAHCLLRESLVRVSRSLCGHARAPSPACCFPAAPAHALTAAHDRTPLPTSARARPCSYNGQRRRDVPDLASGNLYIDVSDRAPRRKRHAFHHELFHMIDYRLRGPVRSAGLTLSKGPRSVGASWLSIGGYVASIAGRSLDGSRREIVSWLGRH